ncbi:MAG: hypothetical protein ACP5D7_22110 [Limnospira sp.]
MKIQSQITTFAIAVPLLLTISGRSSLARHSNGLPSFPSQRESIFPLDEHRPSEVQFPSPEVEQRRPSECYDNGVC